MRFATKKNLLAAALIALVAAGPAAAATLTTPIIDRPDQGWQRCSFVNAGRRALDVTVEIVNSFDGGVLAAQTCTAAPGTRGNCDLFDGNVSFAYCRFTTPGSAADLRAAGYGVTSLGAVDSALPAE